MVRGRYRIRFAFWVDARDNSSVSASGRRRLLTVDGEVSFH
jgi:hypothetical protein